MSSFSGFLLIVFTKLILYDPKGYKKPLMRVQSADTPPEIENLQLSLIRKASISKRLSRVRSLSQSVIQLSRRAIRRANPALNQREAKAASGPILKEAPWMQCDDLNFP